MNKCAIAAVAWSLLMFTDGVASAQSARARIPDTPIRAAATLASPIIATLKEGTPVDVVDLQGDWYRVLVPNAQGKPVVGYVLARLVDVISADGLPQAVAAPPTRPVAQGPPIPPTLAQLPRQRDRVTEREEALRAEVDALRAEVEALQSAPREERRPDDGIVVPQQGQAMDGRGAVRRPVFRAQPQPAGAQYEIFGGYAPFFDPSDSVNLPLGWAASFAGRLNESVAIVGEVGGSYKSASVLGVTLASVSIHTFAAGPKFTTHANNVTVYGQLLGGLALLNTNVLGFGDSAAALALIPGAGVDLPIGHGVGVRLGGEFDLLRGSGGWLNGFRFTTGVVVSR